MKLAAGLAMLGLSACTITPDEPLSSLDQAPANSLSYDWDGDGIPDAAKLIAGEDAIILAVVISGARGQTQQLVLEDDGSLSPPTLALDGNKLVLQQLTGGTTAVFSTHRFAWDSALGAMRLTGLEATLYSRTFAHDGIEAMWDPIAGTLATQTLQLRKDGGDRAYDIIDQRMTPKPVPPIRLENAPSGDSLLPYPYGE